MTEPLQQEFFQVLAEFFERATGKSATRFATPDTFSEAIRKEATRIAKRGEKAFSWGIDALLDFYSRHKTSAFQCARETGGMKLVLGGSSRFAVAHLDAVRKMLLYADTILIPDPVLPWIEVTREEERYPHVNLLQNIFILLHLKPLVDADLTYPAIMVFPSYEKSLEAKDEETIKGIEQLVCHFLSYYTGHWFESIDATLHYARSCEKGFLQQVEENRLFVPPGGVPGINISKGIEDYRQEIRTWRSEQRAKMYLGLSDAELVWNGVCERLAPQWHLLENADELHSQPMLCLDAHWHYYKLCAEMYHGRLIQSSLLKPETVNTLRALGGYQFEWLGNVPIEALARLREQNENEEFRRTISSFTSALHDSAIGDVDRVASEVGRGIASLLGEHRKKAREITDRYARLYGETLVAAWVTLGATFLPALAPFVSLVPPMALVGKYAWDKSGEIKERKQLSRSLMGVLASARRGAG